MSNVSIGAVLCDAIKNTKCKWAYNFIAFTICSLIEESVESFEEDISLQLTFKTPKNPFETSKHTETWTLYESD